ncbi:ankyrin repeat and fibronectin type-III domain-containing protein 1-like isoform X4 [Apostichopus japonicus]|uniref:ankyrin repeat and fibronectin type-III domain-containing protein 1-like isoform X4 n=2 Tax=Stichopus japonicus TaxID=307972 RepID=UPI003AB27101
MKRDKVTYLSESFKNGSHKSKHRSQPSCHSISDLSTLTAHSPIASLHFSSSHPPPNTERPKEAFQEVTADFDMKLSAHERWVRALKKVLKKNSAILQPVSEGAAWRLEDDDAYQPNTSPSLEDTPFAQTCTQLYYTAPPQAQQTTSGDRSPKNGSNGSLVKLARRFSQRGERKEVRAMPLSSDDSQPQHRQRSVSVDSDYESDFSYASAPHDWLINVLLTEEYKRLLQKSPGDVRKAHSMESLVQAGDKSKSANSIPPSPSAPIRLQRSWSAKKRHGSSLEVDTIMERQTDKTKRGSKLINEFQAFFDAVEHQDLDEVEAILKWNTLDVNQANSDDFTALDIAIMTNNMPMARLLLANGARENSRFLMKDARITKLNKLINSAERIIKDLTSRIVNSNKIKDANTKDLGKQLMEWEWQLQLLTRMKKGFESARAPDVPVSVQLTVASSTALHVSFQEPHNVNGASVTRYKIEWTTSEDFQLLSGEHILYDVRNLSYVIQGLIKGTTYYVRVSAFNMKGFGPSQTSSPSCAVPSSWRDCENSSPRFSNQLFLVDELFRKVRDSRPADSAEMRMSSPRASPSQVRKTVRKSLKNFFQSAPKFQKHLKRGIYLATILYHEDRIMVTTEDHIPIVEADENFPSNYQQDFLWFMKVAKTWEDVDLLRTDLSHSNSSSATVLFRNKLLSAVAHLQSVLCVQDLGQLYFEPIRDNHGTMIWLLMSHIKEPRMLPSTAVKWIPLNRMLKRKSMSTETPSASELLMNSLPEKLIHNRSSGHPLTRGLYLAYLRMRSSVDTIRVQVPEKQPNILPHLKIRDNPNVSQEEWQWLHNLDLNEIKSKPSSAQEQFQQQLSDRAKELLKTVNIEERDALAHRICDLEIIELNDEVSVILLFPPPGNVCLGPGTSDEWLIGTDYISVPVPVFELAHLSTYHPNFTRRFARLSSILELDNILSQQTLREAFSDEELTDAKDRQDQIGNFVTNLETIWKSMRWLTDILQYARDRQVTGGVPLSVLYAPPPSPLEMNDNNVNTANPQTEDIDEKVSSLNFNNNQLDAESFMKQKPTSKLTSGILKVYPAYQSGLSKGTSVKLHVTNRTTCREIVNLVIQQLNKTIESRKLDAPLYDEDQWHEFCLIASVGNMEHTLLDDFCPLQLQNPWTKGQLLVRPKEADVSNIGPSTCI